MISSTRHLLSNKTPLRVRLFEPGDREVVIEAFARLSADTRYFRFWTTHPHLFEDQLRHVIHPKKGLSETWGAQSLADAQYLLLGAASFNRKSRFSKRAEISFTISDEAQNLGVATLLLARLWTRAESLKIQQFTGSILFDNYRTLEWFRKLGAKLELKGAAFEFTLAISVLRLPLTSTSLNLLSRLHEFRRFQPPTRLFGYWRD